jgi:predicted transcriptional regulator
MQMNELVHPADNDIVELSAEIVSAYVSNNALSPTDLPRLIADVHAALKGLNGPAPVEVQDVQKPAVSVRKSITPDYLICLEDGKKFKSLKRHLAGLGMSPDEYRAKWKLGSDYPMVAPNYSATRSAMARSIGLGRKSAAPPAKPARKARKATAVA